MLKTVGDEILWMDRHQPKTMRFEASAPGLYGMMGASLGVVASVLLLVVHEAIEDSKWPGATAAWIVVGGVSLGLVGGLLVLRRQRLNWVALVPSGIVAAWEDPALVALRKEVGPPGNAYDTVSGLFDEQAVLVRVYLQRVARADKALRRGGLPAHEAEALDRFINVCAKETAAMLSRAAQVYADSKALVSRYYKDTAQYQELSWEDFLQRLSAERG